MIADIIRFLVVVAGALTGGATVTVITLHYRAWKRAPKGAAGLVPAHVFLIATGHLCYNIGLSVAVIMNLDEPLTVLPVLLFAGSALTLVALWIIGRFQRRRIQITGSSATTTDVESSAIDKDPP